MELYYHKTDGGAEYYSIERGGRGFMRTDGNEIEIFPDRLEKGGPRLIVHGAAMLSEKELDYISRGLVALIRDAGKAKELCLDRKAQREIDRYTKELQALNIRICTMEGGEE
jgi:hypothetical protein